MRLKKSQKQKVLEWIAEGLQTAEINARASGEPAPFSVSRQQVEYYRRTRQIDLETITRVSEGDALSTGYALREHRVKKLQQLAALLERDLFGGFLWTENAKGVGSGAIADIYEYEEFNKAEVEAYRGVIDDIAKETGGRVQKQDITSAGQPIKTYIGVSPDDWDDEQE